MLTLKEIFLNIANDEYANHLLLVFRKDEEDRPCSFREHSSGGSIELFCGEQGTVGKIVQDFGDFGEDEFEHFFVYDKETNDEEFDLLFEFNNLVIVFDQF